MVQQSSTPTLDAQVPIARSHTLPVLSALVLAMIFLQKLALNFGGGSIGLDALLTWAGLGWLFLRREAGLVPLRAGLLLLWLMLIVVSTMLTADSARLSAVAIVLIMYVPFVAQVSLTRREMLRLFDVYQGAMVAIAVIVLAQQAVQYTIGNRFWPNLDQLIPARFLYPGFAYIRPYSWDSPWLTPNGVFFLEPSILSSYMAVAIAIEIIFFQRIRRLALYCVAIVAGVAASGPVSLVLASPFLFWRASPRVRMLMGAGLAALALFIALGANFRPLERVSELSSDNSSAYYRLVKPLQDIGATLEEPDILLSGAGAGASPKGDNVVQWPVSKLLYEYGLLVAIVFHLYFLAAKLDLPEP